MTTAQQRTAEVVGDLINTVNERLVKHEVTYGEYQAAKQWLIELGEAGEWPLFLDVFFEHTVERMASERRRGSTGCIEGPYYVPGSPELDSPATLPRRPDEPGDGLVFSGTVRDLDGIPIPGAVVDIWHADANGFYSQFHPDPPKWNLRGTVRADAEGRFEIHTVLPAPYEIPKEGPTGRMITSAGWHHWRPAHLHMMVRAPGKQTLTSQLFFAGHEYVDDDVAGAVKPELTLELVRHDDGHYTAEYDFRLDPA
ncbi:catechol 1,2-dioxygenase [Prauserella shujinwangii]|uniref:Catechol 1,2-dioxygenase n=1 Tax=Prauserella shujinwangii TaxID=1453103 RepID=A0A2T0LN84_9PSEU|nr:dioxygenase [Prauserella shujinwangii]PRX44619.1 catechol 1,2-dioxygenase [Prauserella shujinwangii]